jgi:hypothetical protein
MTLSEQEHEELFVSRINTVLYVHYVVRYYAYNIIHRGRVGNQKRLSSVKHDNDVYVIKDYKEAMWPDGM